MQQPAKTRESGRRTAPIGAAPPLSAIRGSLGDWPPLSRVVWTIFAARAKGDGLTGFGPALRSRLDAVDFDPGSERRYLVGGEGGGLRSPGVGGAAGGGHGQDCRDGGAGDVARDQAG